MNMVKDPVTGLIMPRQHVDEKQALKKLINDYLENCKQQFQWIDGPYFLTFHAKFDPQDPTSFNVDPPKVTRKLPPFLSNSFVWWINNQKEVCELLWMVAPKKPGEKLKVEFNKSGVAYLQAKGAMPS